MPTRLRRVLLGGGLIALLAGFGVRAEAFEWPDPAPGDSCPVCGMFVAKYPEWIATLVYADGHVHHFDGAKDLFKYLLDRPRWAPGYQTRAIQAIGVTEYYELRRLPAREAWYVIGSEVLGPMGHELIPLATREDAEAFQADHGGRRILRFEEVDAALLGTLDAGRLDSMAVPATGP